MVVVVVVVVGAAVVVVVAVATSSCSNSRSSNNRKRMTILLGVSMCSRREPCMLNCHCISSASFPSKPRGSRSELRG